MISTPLKALATAAGRQGHRWLQSWKRGHGAPRRPPLPGHGVRGRPRARSPAPATGAFSTLGQSIPKDFQPGMVFLDIGMPGMDGYEAARRLRGDPRLRGVVLVALTGWGQDEDRRRSREAGFDHHMVKPVEPAALMELLAGPQLSLG